jgi:hypothetical protein
MCFQRSDFVESIPNNGLAPRRNLCRKFAVVCSAVLIFEQRNSAKPLAIRSRRVDALSFRRQPNLLVFDGYAARRQKTKVGHVPVQLITLPSEE